jgi:hypothetical protein
MYLFHLQVPSGVTEVQAEFDLVGASDESGYLLGNSSASHQMMLDCCPQLLRDGRARGQNVEVFHVKHYTGDNIRIYMCIHWPHIQQTKRVTAHWASVAKATRAGDKLRAGGGAPGFSSLPTLNNIRSTSPQWAHPSEAWVGHPPVLRGVRVGHPL